MLKPPKSILQLLLRPACASLNSRRLSSPFSFEMLGKAHDSDSEFKDGGDFDSDELSVGRSGEEENGDGQDDNKDAEMEEFEKEYMNLHILNNLKCHKNEYLLKGQAVKNKRCIDKGLEFRFLLQKAFSNPSLGVNAAYYDLSTHLNPVVLQLMSRSCKNIDSDEDWSQISQLLIATYRNKSMDKWQRKTEVTTGAAAIKSKLHAFNQIFTRNSFFFFQLRNISEQVASHMRDPSRMVRQMEMRKSAVAIFDTVPKGYNYNRRQFDIVLPTLLKEFFETIDPATSAYLYLNHRLLTYIQQKIVDRRASKSHKIRYNVDEKIVNFMAPETMAVSPMLPDLNNLFGLKKQKPASVV
ncbi:unnamed protein product [Malus baccata var. baccata]